MMLSVIVAIAEQGVIGQKGDLPWRLSADLQRFRRLTMSHHLIMGRRTYESIGRPLPGRTSIVITRDAKYHAPGVLIAGSLPAAITLAGNDKEVFVIGGAQIYALALPYAKRLYLTRVEAAIEGDTFFPHLDLSQWQCVESTALPSDAQNEYATQFEVYDRLGTVSLPEPPAKTERL